MSQPQRDRIVGYLDSGKQQGARAVCGGGRPANLPRGWYIEPTVFADVERAAALEAPGREDGLSSRLLR